MNQTPEKSAVVAPSPEAALTRITDWLNRINGPRSITIEDVTGAKHTVPGVLPARIEARFWRSVRELDAGVLEGRLAAIQEAKGSEDVLATVANTVAAALSDERVLDAADEAFVSAFPAVIAAARENGAAAGFQGNRPSDLFNLGEVALALSPFVVGGLRSLGRMASAFLAPSK